MWRTKAIVFLQPGASGPPVNADELAWGRRWACAPFRMMRIETIRLPHLVSWSTRAQIGGIPAASP